MSAPVPPALKAPGPDWEPLCTVPLEATPERVAAFARALGAEPGEQVPATFAATILSDPALTIPVTALARERGAVLVHQAQEFRYHHALRVGASYRVELDWQQPGGRADRIAIRGRVLDVAGLLVQEIRTDIVFFENRSGRDGT